MPTTGKMWLWAILVPTLTFLSQNMCVWPAPRFLGMVAEMLLTVSAFTLFIFLAALASSVYFGVTSLIHLKQNGEFVRRGSMALSCLCFIGLWVLAVGSANSHRHRAFVRASQVGDRVVQAIALYRNDKGEYPDSLNRLIPVYLEEIP